MTHFAMQQVGLEPQIFLRGQVLIKRRLLEDETDLAAHGTGLTDYVVPGDHCPLGVPRSRVRELVPAMLALVGLADRRSALVRTYSGGMRRRLEIARGLLHAPSILFLDEPTTGLDPQTRAAIWEYLHDMRAEQGITVFLTTHHLEEAENCDRIAIIDAGELVADGTPAALKAVVAQDLVVLRTGDDDLAARLIARRFGTDAQAGPAGVRLRVPDGAGFVPRLCAELAVPVHSVTVTPPTLDDVFLHYTGRTIREADRAPAPLAAALAPRRTP